MKNYVVIYVIVSVIYSLVCGGDLYEKEERLLVSYNVGHDEKVNIYYVNVGATAKEVIQVRLIEKNENDIILSNYEKNFLQGSKFLNDSTLFLVASDPEQ